MTSKTKKEIFAEKMYSDILTGLIYPLVGNKTTYMNDLNKTGIKLLGIKFKGVYPADKIPILNDLKPYCILNLDNSGEVGSHWIALGKIEGLNSCVVYDSFARKNTQIIPNLLKSGNGRIIDSDLSDREQEINETDCGARSLSFLIVLDKFGYEIAKLI
tara:strand:- start:442 stop:918 length:477 start_codon:yes stop_codon:yes gene_type:complete